MPLEYSPGGILCAAVRFLPEVLVGVGGGVDEELVRERKMR
jgi:hypothetical protein